MVLSETLTRAISDTCDIPRTQAHSARKAGCQSASILNEDQWLASFHAPRKRRKSERVNLCLGEVLPSREESKEAAEANGVRVLGTSREPRPSSVVSGMRERMVSPPLRHRNELSADASGSSSDLRTLSETSLSVFRSGTDSAQRAGLAALLYLR